MCGPVRLDYQGLRALAERIGRDLEARGACAGDRVAALFPNCHLYLACYFGALARGMILVPLNLRLSTQEMRAILEHSGARVLIGEPELMAPLLADRPAAEGPGWAAARIGSRDGESDLRPPEGA